MTSPTWRAVGQVVLVYFAVGGAAVTAQDTQPGRATFAEMIAFARLASVPCRRLAPDADSFHALALRRLNQPRTARRPAPWRAGCSCSRARLWRQCSVPPGIAEVANVLVTEKVDEARDGLLGIYLLRSRRAWERGTKKQPPETGGVNNVSGTPLSQRNESGRV